MAEEVHSPSEILPRAISFSVPIGTISGIVFLLPILFTLPDVSTLLQSMCHMVEFLLWLFLSICVDAQLALVNRLVSCSRSSWAPTLGVSDW